MTFLDIRPAIAAALQARCPVVALESTLIAHGLPWPVNFDTALAAEKAVREAGATPATIAVLEGRPTIGLDEQEIRTLAQTPDVLKAGRRDLGLAVAQKRTAATTVGATMLLAHRAGLRVFATGGIGGAHREPWDLSADLVELARLPVAVVCAGAKSILDLPRTLELLETLSVPVLGFATDTFPAFYLVSSGEPVSGRVDSADQAAAVLRAHWDLGGGGAVLAQPLPAEVAVAAAELNAALSQAEGLAAASGVRGKAVTPFLLARLAELTGGKTLRANQALIVGNARLAAEVAAALHRIDPCYTPGIPSA
jgi:pseudouridine-5'-phosphate glycosidase